MKGTRPRRYEGRKEFEMGKRKNAKCDEDCANCTVPAHRCNGGSSRKSANRGFKPTTMKDGKGYMMDIKQTPTHVGKGRRIL